VPVEALERLLAEHRKPAPGRPERRRRGRSATVSHAVADRIVAAHRRGLSLGQIARQLDADRVPPAQGGRRWRPSTIRLVLLRDDRPNRTAAESDGLERT
jgi:hypothetical protein